MNAKINTHINNKTKRTYHYYTADVFTEQAFNGVPIPVFVDASGLSAEQMQQLAGELSTSSTVFLFPCDQAINDRENTQQVTTQAQKIIRIFSPQKELPAGIHTILAASFILAETGFVPLNNKHTPIAFVDGFTGNKEIKDQQIQTYVSKKTTDKVANSKAGLVQQTYNTHAAIDYYTPTNEELAAMLSLSPADIGFDHYKPLIVSCGVPYLIVPIMSYNAIREAKFNEAAWSNSSAPSSLAQEILLFANNTDDNPADFHARLLGPSIAHHEDPPIGGAIAAFANHICSHEHIQVGTHVFGIQRGANDARKSFFFVEMDNNKSHDLTIRVGGYAVLMSTANINL
ncbi:MAG: phenazine biosynthesis protein PhzF [Gammaproteobacteria bacterium]|nr:MAG: phenazine biosynthesis protein PhzF [Gammaproteobacteria bacterium]